jgi:hypothetical protein
VRRSRVLSILAVLRDPSRRDSACHSETTKPVGVHFRLPGYSHGDTVALPLERIRSKCWVVLEEREKFWINKCNAVKLLSVEEIESGLNINWDRHPFKCC